MKLPKDCTVAVCDGEKLSLFRNTGDETAPKLIVVPYARVNDDHSGAGKDHHSDSANPQDHQFDKDSFAAGVSELLNDQVATGKISKLVIIAPAKTLGELRKHYSEKLKTHLLGEISKDLTGSSLHDIEKSVAAA